MFESDLEKSRIASLKICFWRRSSTAISTKHYQVRRRTYHGTVPQCLFWLDNRMRQVLVSEVRGTEKSCCRISPGSTTNRGFSAYTHDLSKFVGHRDVPSRTSMNGIDLFYAFRRSRCFSTYGNVFVPEYCLKSITKISALANFKLYRCAVLYHCSLLRTRKLNKTSMVYTRMVWGLQ